MLLKNSLWLSVLFCFLALTSVFSESITNPSPEVFFKSLKKDILENLPDSFEGELTSASIAKKLETIPKDSYLSSNQAPFAEIRYSKKNGIQIEVKNVEELYRDLYKNLPRQFFAFDIILSSQANEAFLKKYELSYSSYQSNLVILNLKIKSAENNLVLYIEPGGKLIRRIDYKMGNELLVSTLIFYQEWLLETKKLTIPIKFVSKGLKQAEQERPEIYEIKRINFNLPKREASIDSKN
jgi:hypothetical protein